MASVGGGARDGVARVVLGVTSPWLGGCHCPEALGAVRSPRAGSELGFCPLPLIVTLARGRGGWGAGSAGAGGACAGSHYTPSARGGLTYLPCAAFTGSQLLPPLCLDAASM